jgi:SAM-dependent methyltransferase
MLRAGSAAVASEVEARDLATAQGYAEYFRTFGSGSQYTREQFLDFFSPLDPSDFTGQRVIELGFGHGSFLWHWADHRPALLRGVDLGDAVEATRRKLAHLPPGMLDLRQGDLTRVDLGGHDLCYCIGVLHHMQDPAAGFASVLRHTRPGGRFHCWVYAREGNGLVVHLLDPLRRTARRLPWWATKWVTGLLLAVPTYLYALLLRLLSGGAREPRGLLARLPAAAYCVSNAHGGFRFFHFVATDFFVARHTVFLDRSTLESWLRAPEIDPDSVYLVHRNGNSWKFGGRRRPA